MAKQTQAQEIASLKEAVETLTKAMALQGNVATKGQDAPDLLGGAEEASIPDMLIDETADKPFVTEVTKQRAADPFTLGSKPTSEAYESEATRKGRDGKTRKVTRLGGTRLIQTKDNKVYLVVPSKDHVAVGIKHCKGGAHINPLIEFNAGMAFELSGEAIHAVRQIADEMENTLKALQK